MNVLHVAISWFDTSRDTCRDYNFFITVIILLLQNFITLKYVNYGNLRRPQRRPVSVIYI